MSDLICRADVLKLMNDEADKCDDAARWGGSKQYVRACRDAAYAIRDRAAAIAKMPAAPGLHRSFPEAGDGRPLPPMGDELMTAGLDAEDARFVAVQLAQNGWMLTPTAVDASQTPDPAVNAPDPAAIREAALREAVTAAMGVSVFNPSAPQAEINCAVMVLAKVERAILALAKGAAE